MRIIGRKIILKLKWKNIGNKKLCNAIDQLLADLETFDFKVATITDIRKDADCVHSEGFYFFNIHIHRTLILIEMDDEGEATLVWAGSHQEYERTFKNNKATIAKWLRTKNYIE
ncbi:type II toxin-antitoxin system HigB family toxin [Flavobacterium supellecticarium]|uniref:Type II toxin-antitoxin system HigB family toxin n=1 Tax=Flavobacterium supellecticarium TaxID=2565924 RepID=A0A4S4A0U4_9FLAO|nr:type II toxin-antitoxin system HigB family toxin [Flavobacterium supellecticarium]THF51923.1 type II toxin-antitoxin system HigB family toxin [Flavobacterium supellecticarium]